MTENNVAAQAGDEPMPWNRRYDLGASVEAAMLAEIRDWRTYAAQVPPRATADVERMREALQKIARNEITVFDEDEGCDVTVSMDAEEMIEIAVAAIATTKPGA